MWTLPDISAIKLNLPDDRLRWVGKNLPYVDWILTVYSTYIFWTSIYMILKSAHDCSPFRQCTQDNEVEGVFVMMDADIEDHFLLTLCALAVCLLIWLVMELHGAWQFSESQKIREMWERNDEIAWYKGRRRLSANNSFIELIINLYLGKFYNLIVTLFARGVVILAISKYMTKLRAEIDDAENPKNSNGDSHPSVLEESTANTVTQNGKSKKIKKKVRWADISYQ